MVLGIQYQKYCVVPQLVYFAVEVMLMWGKDIMPFLF